MSADQNSPNIPQLEEVYPAALPQNFNRLLLANQKTYVFHSEFPKKNEAPFLKWLMLEQP
jgi:hypothetical protein